MFKYRWNLPFLLENDGLVKSYAPVDGVLTLPVKVEGLSPIEEEKQDNKIDLVNEAVELGLGNKSTLSRLTEETLAKKISEAK